MYGRAPGSSRKDNKVFPFKAEPLRQSVCCQGVVPTSVQLYQYGKQNFIFGSQRRFWLFRDQDIGSEPTDRSIKRPRDTELLRSAVELLQIIDEMALLALHMGEERRQTSGPTAGLDKKNLLNISVSMAESDTSLLDSGIADGEIDIWSWNWGNTGLFMQSQGNNGRRLSNFFSP